MLAFAIVALLVTFLIALLFTLVYPSPDGRRAVWTGGTVAYVVQLVTFAIAKFSSRDQWVAAMGLGMILRMTTLIGLGLYLRSTRALPLGAALVTLVAAFAVTTVIEPLMLKR
jgi:hypothetical protein